MGLKCATGLLAAAGLVAASPAAGVPGNGRLAYAAGDSVYTINADGTGQTAVHAGKLPVFSPDGTRIVYAERPSLAGEPFTIWVAEAEGANARKVGTSPGPWGFAWSPDGTRIAYLSGGAQGGFSLVVTEADGSGTSVASEDANGFPAPSWSPDGTQLAFTTTNEADIAIAKADGSGRYLPIQDGTRDASPAWSPDGSQIAFYRDTWGSFLLYTMRPDGGGLHQLGRVPADDRFAPQWSPDGSRLVFGSREQYSYSRFGPDYKYNVYTVGADGAGERRLTDSWAFVGGADPVWSPDGRRIAFTSARGRTGGATLDQAQLFTMNPDGTCETQVTSGMAPVSPPSWQPLPSASPADPLRCAAVTLTGTVEVSADHPALDEDRIYVYRGVIANNGNVASDPLHFFTTTSTSPFLYVSGTASTGECMLGVDVSCSLPAIPPGGSAEVEIRFHAYDSGVFPLELEVEGMGQTPDGDLSDNVDYQYRRYPSCEISTQNGSTIRAPGGDDLICGTIGRDRIFAGFGDDRVFGGFGHDVIHAGAGFDEVDGGGGTDYVYGEGDADKVHGGFGDDVLIGGNGNDVLWGDAGGDYLKGGPGADRFLAGYGNDLIDSRDGRTEHVYCGYGDDRVEADLRDIVGTDCEKVVRGRAQAKRK